jgi:hypothetical protein
MSRSSPVVVGGLSDRLPCTHTKNQNTDHFFHRRCFHHLLLLVLALVVLRRAFSIEKTKINLSRVVTTFYDHLKTIIEIENKPFYQKNFIIFK